MAAVARYLLDTSATARMARASVRDVIVPIIEAGLAATCSPLDFEACFAARSADEAAAIRRDRSRAYESLPTEQVDWDRALDVQQLLARGGRLRDVGMPDLLIAAIAERHRVTLVHYDRVFDAIAGVTGQPSAWVVPRGSVP